MTAVAGPAREIDMGSPEVLRGWGMTCSSTARVSTPTSVNEIKGILTSSKRSNGSLICRGSGYSYGDPALNDGNLVLDLSRLNRILKWDPEAGAIDVEPGLTIAHLCEFASRIGRWPPVVPGTAAPTVGGCISANVHGKNNWRMGPIGEHVDEIEVLLADGSHLVCGPQQNQDVFNAVVGGFGLLGVVTRIRLTLPPSLDIVHMEQRSVARLDDMLAALERWGEWSDSMVGWVDGFASGGELGRGLVRVGTLVEDGRRGGSNASKPQGRRGRLFKGVRSAMWPLMLPLRDDRAARLANEGQYLAGALRDGYVFFTTLARSDFFHDAVPHWNSAFRPGLIQYQIFLPTASASTVFKTALERAQEIESVPRLAVVKRHRSDQFLLSYGVDGYSLSMDFHLTRSNQTRLRHMLDSLTDETVLPAGGRFYLAKDSILNPCQMTRSVGQDAVREFLITKGRLDPDELFQSDLYRRLFLPLANGPSS